MRLIAQTLTYANAFRRQFGVLENSTWTEMASNLLFLCENGITLEYTTMDNSIQVKQADVVLITYPLTYNATIYTTSDALADLNYVRDF
jgi:hypothetical protein